MFTGLGKKDLDTTKRAMIRRANDLTDQRKQKEELLAKLYKELETQTAANVNEEMAAHDVETKI